jgi:putative ABC transport system permease protein
MALSHYIKIARRNMARQKMYAAIKIGGFAIGIAACILVSLLIRHELSYDKHIPGADKIYRVALRFKDNDRIENGVHFPAPMAKAIQANFPEVENAGRLMSSNLFDGAGSNQVRTFSKPENHYEEGFTYVDQSWLDILHVPMVYGERSKALAEPNTIVISKKKADKYFPGENPVGKLLILNDNKASPYKVGGVMEDFPTTSHLQYDFLLTMTGKSLWPGEQDTWMAQNYGIYLRLRKGTEVRSFEKRLHQTIVNKYYLPAMKSSGMVDAEELVSKAAIFLQPVTDIHLRSYDFADWDKRGDIRFVWMFGAVAVFILLIACINFLNLSTARSSKRAKEVGLRKVIGSQRRELIHQFLVESMLYSFLAFIIAVIIAAAVLPVFNQIAGRELAMPWATGWFVPALILSSLLTGLLAGVYPSFYLSAFRPISVLKGNLSLGVKNGGLRSALVIFQFTTSIVLLVGTFVIYRQMQFILNSKLGFDKEQVLLVKGTSTLREKTKTFRDELVKLPFVKNVSVSDYLPVSGTKRNGNTFWKEGKITEEAGVQGQRWAVDENYLNTLGIKLIAGRNFSKDMPTDSQAIIINRSMAEKIGYDDAIGKIITNGDNFRVIGVVEDFHFESMKEKVLPLVLNFGNSNDIVAIKLNGGDIKKHIAAVNTIWKRFAPNLTMRYDFLDESFAAMYADVQRTGYIFTGFAVLALIVACLGLFALAAYMAEQRSKELSIRKVLGASATALFALLTGNFMKLIGISLLIAIPLAWWLMQRWLEDFVYRIHITWDLFIWAGVSIVFISMVTICHQAIKAAIANPVRSLRSE